MRGAINHPRSEDQSAFDADIFHHHARKVAADDHQAERERVRSIDELGRLLSSSTKGVHRSPDSGRGEVA